jgi:hypothetical protein
VGNGKDAAARWLDTTRRLHARGVVSLRLRTSRGRGV